MSHFFHVMLAYDCTFFLLLFVVMLSIYGALFPCHTLFSLYFYHVTHFSVAHFDDMVLPSRTFCNLLFPYCNFFFILSFFYVSLFSLCFLSLLTIFHVALFSYCTFSMVHLHSMETYSFGTFLCYTFFHVAFFQFALFHMYCFLVYNHFLLHSFQVALFHVIFFSCCFLPYGPFLCLK